MQDETSTNTVQDTRAGYTELYTMKLQTLTLLLLAIIFASSFIISTESTTIKTDNRILKPKSSIEADEATQQQEDIQTNTGQDKGQADFLNQIERIDEEAQEGVCRRGQVEKAKVEMQIEKLKADTKAEKVREASKNEWMIKQCKH